MTNLSSALLDPLLRADPAGPRITYYDDATGERIEVSAVTLGNWAAKTANLLRDELGAGPGSRVAVLLPAHWQTAGVLFGIWYIGAEVVIGEPLPTECDVAMCTADLIGAADETGAAEVVVLSLDPFGKPVPDLPIGVTDYATSVRVHGDQIVPERTPGPALAGRSAPRPGALPRQRDSPPRPGSCRRRRGVPPTNSWPTCWRCSPAARPWCRWPTPTRAPWTGAARRRRSLPTCSA